MIQAELTAFTAGYCEAMVWANVAHNTETGDGPEAGFDELSEDVRRLMKIDAALFAGTPRVAELLATATKRPAYGWEQAGHDYALTRNGHGVGFWDRGIEEGLELTMLAESVGGMYLYADEDAEPAEWTYAEA